MSKIKAILAGGPPAILAAGGGIMYVQHEIHYLLRPSIIETLAGIASLGGAMVWANSKSKNASKAKEEQKSTEAPMIIASFPSALPAAQKVTHPLYVQRTAQRQKQI